MSFFICQTHLNRFDALQQFEFFTWFWLLSVTLHATLSSSSSSSLKAALGGDKHHVVVFIVTSPGEIRSIYLFTVNNVGRMYDYPDTVDRVPEDIIWDVLTINIGAVTMLTRKIVPQMKRARRGAIVNIGSGSELQPTPYISVYAATKKYITYFTQALEQELAEHNVTVQLVKPMFVTTKMNEYSDTVMQGGFLIPNARSYARSAVFTLGKTSETNGFWTHGLQVSEIKIIWDYSGGWVCVTIQ